ncbi:putative DNA-binding domain-containing protein [Neptunicoccus sediminis]|uniref:HvfC/BufC family peptide modification chaperone n=1 Tax=Neptunicoccus sediminis TaxID=1892596 RepID=UPI000845D4A5
MAVQSQFAQALLDPAHPVPDGVVDPSGRPAGKRFNVYRNNVVVSLLDAMETAFPVIRKLIGTENFRNLAGLYVRQHPPKSPLLMFYGTDFPAFLDGFTPLAHVPYLADVARLELARRSAYHAADATPVPADALSQIAPARLMHLRFTLAPALQIVPSPYPVVALWDYNMTPDAPQPPAEAQTALITRPAFDLHMQVIPPAVAAFLGALRQGNPLDTAFDTASALDGAFDLTAGIVLLLQSELIVEIHL